MILGRAAALWLTAADAAVNLAAAIAAIVTGTALDPTLVLGVNGFVAAIIALIANSQVPAPAGAKLATVRRALGAPAK